eukprot:Phypoly_transcript_03640.p1 GENE.Phypoly_transcript_03640~~Phypoly_transcript_03640.p1  ORF type:complete len:689 (+),score=130.60 Phypoly_transcript_03640:232-2298(+)
MSYVYDMIIYNDLLYVGTSGAIRTVSLTTGALGTIAGNGTYNEVVADGPTGVATANSPNFFSVHNNQIYFVDGGSTYKIRYFTTAGVVTSVMDGYLFGFDTAGNMWVYNYKSTYSSGNFFLIRYSSTGSVQVNITGAYYSSITPTVPFMVDGNQNTAVIPSIDALVVIGDDVYFSDNLWSVIRKITVAGGGYTVTTVVGSPKMRDGPAQSATIGNLNLLATDAAGNIFMWDTMTDGNYLWNAFVHTVRYLTPDGHVYTIAGRNGTTSSFPKVQSGGYYGGLAADLDGTLYVTGPYTGIYFYSIKIYSIQNYSRGAIGTETFVAGSDHEYTDTTYLLCDNGPQGAQGANAIFCDVERMTYDPHGKTLYINEQQTIKNLVVVNKLENVFYDFGGPYIYVSSAFDRDTGRLWAITPLSDLIYWDSQTSNQQSYVTFGRLAAGGPQAGMCAGNGFVFVLDQAGHIYAYYANSNTTTYCTLLVAGGTVNSTDYTSPYQVITDGPASTARVMSPDGCVVSNDGKTLYFTDYTLKKLDLGDSLQVCTNPPPTVTVGVPSSSTTATTSSPTSSSPASTTSPTPAPSSSTGTTSPPPSPPTTPTPPTPPPPPTTRSATTSTPAPTPSTTRSPSTSSTPSPTPSPSSTPAPSSTTDDDNVGGATPLQIKLSHNYIFCTQPKSCHRAGNSRKFRQNGLA